VSKFRFGRKTTTWPTIYNYTHCFVSRSPPRKETFAETPQPRLYDTPFRTYTSARRRVCQHHLSGGHLVAPRRLNPILFEALPTVRSTLARELSRSLVSFWYFTPSRMLPEPPHSKVSPFRPPNPNRAIRLVKSFP
jgi:hypothetical protein